MSPVTHLIGLFPNQTGDYYKTPDEVKFPKLKKRLLQMVQLFVQRDSGKMVLKTIDGMSGDYRIGTLNGKHTTKKLLMLTKTRFKLLSTLHGVHPKEFMLG